MPGESQPSAGQTPAKSRPDAGQMPNRRQTDAGQVPAQHRTRTGREQDEGQTRAFFFGKRRCADYRRQTILPRNAGMATSGAQRGIQNTFSQTETSEIGQMQIDFTAQAVKICNIGSRDSDDGKYGGECSDRMDTERPKPERRTAGSICNPLRRGAT